MVSSHLSKSAAGVAVFFLSVLRFGFSLRKLVCKGALRQVCCLASSILLASALCITAKGEEQKDSRTLQTVLFEIQRGHIPQDVVKYPYFEVIDQLRVSLQAFLTGGIASFKDSQDFPERQNPETVFVQKVDKYVQTIQAVAQAARAGLSRRAEKPRTGLSDLSVLVKYFTDSPSEEGVGFQRQLIDSGINADWYNYPTREANLAIHAKQALAALDGLQIPSIGDRLPSTIRPLGAYSQTTEVSQGSDATIDDGSAADEAKSTDAKDDKTARDSQAKQFLPTLATMNQVFENQPLAALSRASSREKELTKAWNEVAELTLNERIDKAAVLIEQWKAKGMSEADFVRAGAFPFIEVAGLVAAELEKTIGEVGRMSQSVTATSGDASSFGKVTVGVAALHRIVKESLSSDTKGGTKPEELQRKVEALEKRLQPLEKWFGEMPKIKKMFPELKEMLANSMMPSLAQYVGKPSPSARAAAPSQSPQSASGTEAEETQGGEKALTAKEYVEALAAKIRAGEVGDPRDELEGPEYEKHRLLWMKRAEKIIDQNLIGQPHIAQTLKEMVWEHLTMTSVDEPRPLTMMGIPGTGKDTAVEVFVRAVLGDVEGDVDLTEYLYTIDRLQTEMDISANIGSGTGYVGSDQFGPLVKFLIEASGKYILENAASEEEKLKGKKTWVVRKNPRWDGRTKFRVLFLNEFGEYVPGLVDQIKMLIEKGYTRVPNPGVGESSIQVPGIHFMLASNQGQHLVIPNMEPDGSMRGPAPTYQDMIRNFEAVVDQQSLLLEAFRQGATDPKTGVKSQFSAAIVSRANSGIVTITKPLAPDEVVQIARLILDKKIRHFKKAHTLGVDIQVRYSNSLLREVALHGYQPELGARDVKGRLNQIMALLRDHLKNLRGLSAIASQGKTVRLNLGIRTIRSGEHRGAKQLRIRQVIGKGQPKQFFQLIPQTLNLVQPRPLTDQRIEQIRRGGEEAKTEVFGYDEVIDRIVRGYIAIEEATQAGTKVIEPGKKYPRAQVQALDGPTSVGKTELAKAIRNKLFPQTDSEGGVGFVQFSMGSIKSPEQLREKLFGRSRDSRSELAVALDSYRRVLLLIDEADKAHPEVWDMFLDMFREGVVGFSDKPRITSGLMILLTSNVIQQIIEQIPMNQAAPDVLERSLRRVIDEIRRNPGQKTLLMNQAFSPPLVARIDLDNIHIANILDHEAKRQVVQIHLQKGLEEIASQQGKRGIQISFATEADYWRLVRYIEEKAFNVKTQGASIAAWVRQFVQNVNDQVYDAKMANGSQWQLRIVEEVSEDPFSRVPIQPGLKFELIPKSARGEPVSVFVSREMLPFAPERTTRASGQTAIHEGAHWLAREVLAPWRKGMMITIKPELINTGHSWILASGYAQSEELTYHDHTYDVMLRDAGVLLAGGLGQHLTSRYPSRDTGISNDYQRAEAIAMMAVFHANGYDKPRGVNREGEDMNEFIDRLPEAERVKFHEEKTAFLSQAKRLAEVALLVNYEALVELGSRLSQKGDIFHEELDAFAEEYEQKGEFLREEDPDFRRQFFRWSKYLDYRDALADLAATLDQGRSEKSEALSQVLRKLFPMKWEGFEEAYLNPGSASQGSGLIVLSEHRTPEAGYQRYVEIRQTLEGIVFRGRPLNISTLAEKMAQNDFPDFTIPEPLRDLTVMLWGRQESQLRNPVPKFLPKIVHRFEDIPSIHEHLAEEKAKAVEGIQVREGILIDERNSDNAKKRATSQKAKAPSSHSQKGTARSIKGSEGIVLRALPEGPMDPNAYRAITSAPLKPSAPSFLKVLTTTGSSSRKSGGALSCSRLIK